MESLILLLGLLTKAPPKKPEPKAPATYHAGTLGHPRGGARSEAFDSYMKFDGAKGGNKAVIKSYNKASIKSYNKAYNKAYSKASSKAYQKAGHKGGMAGMK